jgi:D-sedoheptulose 7-phosphate isomerase
VAGGVDPEDLARRFLRSSARLAEELVDDEEVVAAAARAGKLLGEALRSGGKVMFCGNGGSAADAQHLAAELVGRLDRGRERPPLSALALTTDTSILSAVANDLGFEEVFARQVEGLGRPGDALVCISTSGSSPNVILAAEAARDRGVSVIALLGPARSRLDDLADVALHAPGESSVQVQHGHGILGHLLCELAEAGATG